MMKLKTIIISCCVLLACIPQTSGAYEVNVHRSLTENAVREYTRLGGALPINPSDLMMLSDGAEHEDLGHRPLNHFYDPIHNSALTKAGVALGLPSPLWAVDTQAQFRSAGEFATGTLYFDGTEDFSWDRAVYDYVHGDKKRGLMALGQVLHLLEDATSPAHTRNDAHSGHWFDGDDPYETLTHTFTSNVSVSPLEVPVFNSPAKAIQATAYFTNTNFFSRDTVDDFELPSKKELVDITRAGITYASKNGVFLIQHEKFLDPTTLQLQDVYTYPKNDIVQIKSNWSALSHKAVANGVGLIRLFEVAVAEEKKTHALLDKNRSLTTLVAMDDTRALANSFSGVQGAQTASTLTAFTPAADPNPVPLQPAQPVDLASYFPPDTTPLATSTTSATVHTPTLAAPQPPAEQTAFSVHNAYSTTSESSQQSAESNTNQNTTTQTLAVTLGNLQPLGYGSGVGGGGGETVNSSQNTVDSSNQTQTPVQTQTQQTPATPTPVVCTLPQVRDEATNTCVTPEVTCVSPQVRDVVTNTCVLPARTGPTPLPTTFTTDTTLSYAASPYYSNPTGSQPIITIPAGITVTIEPGTILKLTEEVRIVVDGTLRIQGTPTLPTTLTSLYADTSTQLGTTDATVAAENSPTFNSNHFTPANNTWAGILITPTGTLTTTNTTLSYAGWNPGGPGTESLPRATIRNQGTLSLTDSIITNSSSVGIAHEGTSFTSTNLTLDTLPTALALSAPNYNITNTVIRHATSTSTAVVTLTNLDGKLTGTIGESNPYNGITFPSLTIPANTTAHLYPNVISYYTEQNQTIMGTLILHPNTFIQNVENTWTVTGTGSIQTTDETGTHPVMTSLWDNVNQGESRGTVFPNQNRAPKVGDWGGVNADEGGVVDELLVKKFNKI